MRRGRENEVGRGVLPCDDHHARLIGAREARFASRQQVAPARHIGKQVRAAHIAHRRAHDHIVQQGIDERSGDWRAATQRGDDARNAAAGVQREAECVGFGCGQAEKWRVDRLYLVCSAEPQIVAGQTAKLIAVEIDGLLKTLSRRQSGKCPVAKADVLFLAQESHRFTTGHVRDGEAQRIILQNDVVQYSDRRDAGVAVGYLYRNAIPRVEGRTGHRDGYYERARCCLRQSSAHGLIGAAVFPVVRIEPHVR